MESCESSRAAVLLSGNICTCMKCYTSARRTRRCERWALVTRASCALMPTAWIRWINLVLFCLPSLLSGQPSAEYDKTSLSERVCSLGGGGCFLFFRKPSALLRTRWMKCGLGWRSVTGATFLLCYFILGGVETVFWGDYYLRNHMWIFLISKQCREDHSKSTHCCLESRGCESGSNQKPSIWPN